MKNSESKGNWRVFNCLKPVPEEEEEEAEVQPVPEEEEEAEVQPVPEEEKRKRRTLKRSSV